MTTLVDVAREAAREAGLQTYVAAPGIIKAFNPAAQEVTVQLAIKKITAEQSFEIPPLIEVPILIPTVGGFHITMPIQPGDECLVVFSDRCIDKWVISSGLQEPAENRIHDISDGFAIIGVNSRPNAISNYSSSSLEVRNDVRNQRVELRADGAIHILSPDNIYSEADQEAEFRGKNTTLQGTSTIDIDSDGIITITGANITIAARTGGETTMTGTFRMTGSFILNGVEMETHRHQENDVGGLTGVPQ